MDPSLIKAILMDIAYEGALAVLGNLNTVIPAGASAAIPVNADPLVKDSGMQAKGIAVYEEAKVQYAVLVQAFQDSTGIWPNPQLAAPAAVPASKAPAAQAATAAVQALTQNPNSSIATLAQQLLAAVQAAAATVAPSAAASPVPSLAGAVAAGS
jgi:acetylornithine deacetylase/succinyl-diaminopimelate desuccinylase-like protein